MALFSFLETFSVFPLAAAISLGFFMLLVGKRCTLNLPPVVPGSLSLLGNLLQLKAKKPHETFARWVEIHGLIYSIKTGASTLVVLNSTELAKEAMVTRYPSISSRKLSKALTLLTSNKSMVAMSDYDEFHKMVKRYILASVLGANVQDIGVHTMRLMTNNPVKCTDLKGYGLVVVGRVPVLSPIKGKSKISRNKAYKDGQCLWFKFA